MKFSQVSRWCAALFVLVALSAGEASAQFAPTLTVTATGNSVTIQWTPVTGALGYTIIASTTAGGSDIAVVNLPAIVTRIVVSAPNGTYFLRVRATAGGLAGPFSNEGSVSVGLQPCVPGQKPVVTATPEGRYVNLSWTPVAGATGYVIQWSRYSGGTELAETAASTSARKLVGMAGTFYARVVAVSECGPAVSDEVSFTLDLASGGPRTPTPPSGRISLNDPILQQGQFITENFGLYDRGGCNFNWIHDLVARLREIDTRFGYNCKRGVRNPNGSCSSVSRDIVAFNWGNELDEGTHEVYTFDVIYNHCNPDGSSASPGWNNTQPPPYAGLSSWTGAGRY